MKDDKIDKLKVAGWSVGSTSEFLGLSKEEEKFVEFKMTLANAVKQLRKTIGLTQVDLAKRIGSSQSRIAKMEASDSSVSTDLMMKSLFSLGASSSDIAKIFSTRKSA